MKKKKHIGSYYTPQIIADFLVDYLSFKICGNALTILEPSAGDGVFIRSIFNHKDLSKRVEKIVAVEREETEIKKINLITGSVSLETSHSDFLDFQNDNDTKFDIVLGNPPYIRKNLLAPEQVAICNNIHKENPSLSKNKIKNIWTAFLVRSISFVNDSGVIAFVLPSELLQVKFASELRSLLLNEFERIEIFTFNELLFKECKGQDTLLLIGERKSLKKGVYYCNIDKLKDLHEKNFSLAQNINIRESKWTHHHLTTEEIDLLEKLKKQISTINQFCSSKAGIVTAANDYFIIDIATIKEFSLHRFVKPIIKRGSFVNGNVILTMDEFENLVINSKPTYLIALDKSIKIRKNERINQYLDRGIALKIHERYKTLLREKWFEIPNIGNPPDAFFFKRCNEYPKLVKNEAKVLSTDSAYVISMKNGFKIEDLIFSFYNSLTLSFAELNGRYYGGGVLELTPNEFKDLPVPFLKTDENQFNSFIDEFKKKASIKDICLRNDTIILKSIDKDLDLMTINKIFHIREKLFLRRIKTN